MILVVFFIISLLYIPVTWIVLKIHKWHFSNFRDRMCYYFDANFRLFSDLQMLYKACCISENCSIPFFKSEAERMLESWSHYYRVRANLLLSYEDLFVEYFNVPNFTKDTLRSLMWRLRYKESKANVIAVKPLEEACHLDEVEECELPQKTEFDGCAEMLSECEEFLQNNPLATMAITQLVDKGFINKDFSIPNKKGAKGDAILALSLLYGDSYLDLATLMWPDWPKDNMKSLKRKEYSSEWKRTAMREKLNI